MLYVGLAQMIDQLPSIHFVLQLLCVIIFVVFYFHHLLFSVLHFDEEWAITMSSAHYIFIISPRLFFSSPVQWIFLTIQASVSH